jgi:hypothetical protein
VKKRVDVVTPASVTTLMRLVIAACGTVAVTCVSVAGADGATATSPKRTRRVLARPVPLMNTGAPRNPNSGANDVIVARATVGDVEGTMLGGVTVSVGSGGTVGVKAGGSVGVGTGGCENVGSDGVGTNDASVDGSADGKTDGRVGRLLGLAMGATVAAVVGTPSCSLGDAPARAPVRTSHPQSASASSV